jgi:hypothetical protein
MSKPALYFALLTLIVVGVLGIVAISSSLQRLESEPDLRRRPDREANRAVEGDDLLP